MHRYKKDENNYKNALEWIHIFGLISFTLKLSIFYYYSIRLFNSASRFSVSKYIQVEPSGLISDWCRENVASPTRHTNLAYLGSDLTISSSPSF